MCTCTPYVAAAGANAARSAPKVLGAPAAPHRHGAVVDERERLRTLGRKKKAQTRIRFKRRKKKGKGGGRGKGSAKKRSKRKKKNNNKKKKKKKKKKTLVLEWTTQKANLPAAAKPAVAAGAAPAPPAHGCAPCMQSKSNFQMCACLHKLKVHATL
jgi:hypothetical protein